MVMEFRSYYPGISIFGFILDPERWISSPPLLNGPADFMSHLKKDFLSQAAYSRQRLFDPDGLPVHNNSIVATGKG